VIRRDRAGNYAEGARDGAPDAIQVADRWHLWHNLAGHAEETVVAHRACLKEQTPEPGDGGGMPPGQEPAGERPAPPAEPDGLRDVCGRERRLVTRTRERHAAIWELLAAWHSLAAISRALGLDRQTVQRFAREPDVARLLVRATSRDSRLDPFKPLICQRWNEGITDAAVLHAELQARAGRAASRPSAATSAPSASWPPRRPRPRPSPRPARSPAGCCPARPASTPAGTPSSTASAPAAPTSMPWPPT
jgi:hypothetical protein